MGVWWRGLNQNPVAGSFKIGADEITTGVDVELAWVWATLKTADYTGVTVSVDVSETSGNQAAGVDPALSEHRLEVTCANDEISLTVDGIQVDTEAAPSGGRVGLSWRPSATRSAPERSAISRSGPPVDRASRPAPLRSGAGRAGWRK
jgi:hypothetical protein